MDKKTEKLFEKAKKAAAGGRRSHGVARSKYSAWFGMPLGGDYTRYGSTDWISKDGKWSITIHSGKIRIDDRRNAETFFGTVSMTGEVRLDTRGRKLPRHVRSALDRMIAKPPLEIPSSWRR